MVCWAHGSRRSRYPLDRARTDQRTRCLGHRQRGGRDRPCRLWAAPPGSPGSRASPTSRWGGVRSTVRSRVSVRCGSAARAPAGLAIVDSTDRPTPEAMQQAAKLHNLLRVNTALDVVYVASGLFTIARRRRWADALAADGRVCRCRGRSGRSRRLPTRARRVLRPTRGTFHRGRGRADATAEMDERGVVSR